MLLKLSFAEGGFRCLPNFLIRTKTKPYESFQLQWSCKPGTTLQIRGSVLDTSPPRKQRKGRTPGRKLRALCARGDASTAACSALSRTSTRVGRIRPGLGFGPAIAATLETLPGSRQAADRGVTLRCPRVPGLAGLGTRGLPGGTRASGTSKFVAGWTGLWSLVGSLPWPKRWEDLGFSRSKDRAAPI